MPGLVAHLQLRHRDLLVVRILPVRWRALGAAKNPVAEGDCECRRTRSRRDWIRSAAWRAGTCVDQQRLSTRAGSVDTCRRR